MAKHVVFFRPVEKVGVIFDLLNQYQFGNFPVIDTRDGDILYGTIGRNQLCILIQKRAFGKPLQEINEEGKNQNQSIHSDYINLEPDNQRYAPLVQWEDVQRVSNYAMKLIFF